MCSHRVISCPVVPSNQSCSLRAGGVENHPVPVWMCPLAVSCPPWLMHLCRSSRNKCIELTSWEEQLQTPMGGTSQKAEHKFEGLIFRAWRQVSYWGCFGLFNGPVGNLGQRKEFKSYESSALMEIYFTVRLLFIFLVPIFISSCFLPSFLFSDLE